MPPSFNYTDADYRNMALDVNIGLVLTVLVSICMPALFTTPLVASMQSCPLSFPQSLYSGHVYVRGIPEDTRLWLLDMLMVIPSFLLVAAIVRSRW